MDPARVGVEKLLFCWRDSANAGKSNRFHGYAAWLTTLADGSDADRQADPISRLGGPCKFLN